MLMKHINKVLKKCFDFLVRCFSESRTWSQDVGFPFERRLQGRHEGDQVARRRSADGLCQDWNYAGTVSTLKYFQFFYIPSFV